MSPTSHHGLLSQAPRAHARRRRREKQLKKLEGGDVGDEDELSEEDKQWVARAGGLLRENGTTYRRKLNATSLFAGFHAGDEI